jgi:hypothetical protein
LRAELPRPPSIDCDAAAVRTDAIGRGFEDEVVEQVMRLISVLNRLFGALGQGIPRRKRARQHVLQRAVIEAMEPRVLLTVAAPLAGTVFGSSSRC